MVDNFGQNKFVENDDEDYGAVDQSSRFVNGSVIYLFSALM